MIDGRAGRLLISGSVYFPDRASADRNGIDAADQHIPRSGHHVVVSLGRFQIAEADWSVRQELLDDGLSAVLEAAERRADGFVDRESNFALRIGVDVDDGQLSFLLPPWFLQRWSELGGSIAVDA